MGLRVPDAIKGHGRPCRAGMAQRSQDQRRRDSRGVTVEEMGQASIALMRLVPTGPIAPRKVGTAVGINAVGSEPGCGTDCGCRTLAAE